MLDSAETVIPCPQCGQKTKKSVGWIKTHDHLVCGGCGASIRIDAKQLSGTVKKIDKAMGHLRKTLGKLGK